jgi:AraC-like DNA-binding protein
MSRVPLGISICDIFFGDFVDKNIFLPYNDNMITFQSLLLASESYTHDNWVYQDICVGFSRLYYILEGEAYYEENGKKVQLKKGHLYLTPVKRRYTIYENPENKLLHTYAHIITKPAVLSFTEIEVKEGTLLHDAVMLYRKYIHEDENSLASVIQLILSCIEGGHKEQTVAEKAKEYLDGMDDFVLDMTAFSKEVGYSREHITRSFLSAYHVTPRQYFELGRMNAALLRLMEGKRVIEVSEEMRFSSPYAFSKAFKKHFGLSPTKYLDTIEMNKL